MKGAGIDFCTPLMMDLLMSAPNARDVNHPYDKQIDLISSEALKYPWKIFPFVMFDPRRPDAADICIEALKNRGFIGVKMYPALGYRPSIRFYAGKEPETSNLKKLYDYCGNGRILITAHASTGGAYSTYLDKDREKGAWPFTEVSNWIDSIRDYNLKINFAHFGGNYLNPTDKKRVQSASWRREILNLIAYSKQEENFGDVYTDLSFHDMALYRKTRSSYFKGLSQLLETEAYSHRILFGTNASMISHTWSEREFIKPFIKNLSSTQQEKIFSDNPTNFLFRDGQIPDSYVRFLETHQDSQKVLANTPDWIVKTEGKYCMYTGS